MAITKELKSEEGKDKQHIIKRKAIQKMTNDLDKLPTHVILQRIYKRHNTGLWQFMTACITIIFVAVTIK